MESQKEVPQLLGIRILASASVIAPNPRDLRFELLQDLFCYAKAKDLPVIRYQGKFSRIHAVWDVGKWFYHVEERKLGDPFVDDKPVANAGEAVLGQ